MEVGPGAGLTTDVLVGRRVARVTASRDDDDWRARCLSASRGPMSRSVRGADALRSEDGRPRGAGWLPCCIHGPVRGPAGSVLGAVRLVLRPGGAGPAPTAPRPGSGGELHEGDITCRSDRGGPAPTGNWRGLRNRHSGGGGRASGFQCERLRMSAGRRSARPAAGRRVRVPREYRPTRSGRGHRTRR